MKHLVHLDMSGNYLQTSALFSVMPPNTFNVSVRFRCSQRRGFEKTVAYSSGQLLREIPNLKSLDLGRIFCWVSVGRLCSRWSKQTGKSHPTKQQTIQRSIEDVNYRCQPDGASFSRLDGQQIKRSWRWNISEYSSRMPSAWTKRIHYNKLRNISWLYMVKSKRSRISQ